MIWDPFLTSAEEWLAETFTSQDYFREICALPDVKQTKIIASRIVVAEAFRQAIPNLDVILTPNGFGIVSNSNVAPCVIAGQTRRADRAIPADPVFGITEDQIGAVPVLWGYDVPELECLSVLSTTARRTLGTVPCHSGGGAAHREFLCQTIPLYATS